MAIDLNSKGIPKYECIVYNIHDFTNLALLLVSKSKIGLPIFILFLIGSALNNDCFVWHNLYTYTIHCTLYLLALNTPYVKTYKTMFLSQHIS